VIGGVIASNEYAHVPIALGAATGTTTISVAPGRQHVGCGYEGRIGVRDLTRCAIVVGADAIRIGCGP